MTLSHRPLHRRGGVEVRTVACRPRAPEPGPVEHATNATLILPTAGAFRLHFHLGRGRDQTFVADPTQAIFLPPGQPHRYSHPVAGGDDCLAIELPAARLAELLDELDPAATDRASAPYPVHRVPLPLAALARRRLLEIRLASGVASDLEVDESLAELAGAWTRARRADEGRRAGDALPAGDHRERIEAVQLLLASDPGRDWRLAGIARRVASSPCHLTTLFRRATGVPVHRYLVRLRLARALVEVVGSRRELTAIGAELGFSTPSHFAASFRTAFGRPPSELRKNSTARDRRAP
jgi:AraC family transcriptional regulator